MSNYIKTRVYLSEGQVNKIKAAFKKKEEVSLQIDRSKSPNHDLHLTKTQKEQILKGKRITLSKTQLEKTGGFLPFLAPLLGLLATGAATGAASWGTQKLLNKATGSGCDETGGFLHLIHLITKAAPLIAALNDIAVYNTKKATGSGCSKKKKSHGKGVLQNWEYQTKR
jgi:hypothetical protein